MIFSEALHNASDLRLIYWRGVSIQQWWVTSSKSTVSQASWGCSMQYHGLFSKKYSANNRISVISSKLSAILWGDMTNWWYSWSHQCPLSISKMILQPRGRPTNSGTSSKPEKICESICIAQLETSFGWKKSKSTLNFKI